MNSPLLTVLRAEQESSVKAQPPKEADTNASLPLIFPIAYLTVQSAWGSQGDQEGEKKHIQMGTDTLKKPSKLSQETFS